MSVLICPGIHPPELTQHFLSGLSHSTGSMPVDYLVFPSDQHPAYSTPHILQFLRHQLSNPLYPQCEFPGIHQYPLVLVSFSAGVAGAIATAWAWRIMGGTVKALIALDGWGVPLYGDFPIHRLSHDAFTHWTSSVLGSGEESFYADPPVPHLQLWRSPHTTEGWRVQPSPVRIGAYRPPASRTRTTAAQFLRELLHRYGEL